VPVGNETYTMWGLTVFLISTLMASVYLFALSYIRHSFGKYQQQFIIKWIFKIIIFFANFFYSVALIFPLLAILGSLVNSSPLGDFTRRHSTGIWIFDVVGVIFLVGAAVFNAWFLGKKKDN